MLEIILSILIVTFVCLPLTLELIQTFRGKRIVKKGEMFTVIVVASILTGLMIVRVCLGSGYKSVSGWDVYFILLAVADIIVYRKQQKGDELNE